MPLLSVPFGGRFMLGVKRCVFPWPLISAVESRSEAASALRASSRNMAVAVGQLLKHKHIGFSYGREAVLTAHYIASFPFLQT